MKTFKDLYSLNESTAEAKKLFGDVLFGEFKNYYGKTVEKDTKEESKIFKELMDFVHGDLDNKDKKDFYNKVIKKLATVKKQFPDILKPIKSNAYYRKLGFTENEFKKLGLTADDFTVPFWNDEYTESKEILFKPKSIVQSWTVDFGSVEFFEPDEKDIEVILVAKKIPESELLFNPTFLNKIAVSHGYVEEYEVIRYSNKPVKVTVIVDERNLNFIIDYIGYTDEDV